MGLFQGVGGRQGKEALLRLTKLTQGLGSGCLRLRCVLAATSGVVYNIGGSAFLRHALCSLPGGTALFGHFPESPRTKCPKSHGKCEVRARNW